MSYYNSDLDAFTLYHQHQTHDHDLHNLHHPPPRHHHNHHGLHLPHLPHLPHPHIPHAPDLNKFVPRQETVEAALPTLGQAVSGSIGSAIANLAVYPLDVVVKRLQVQRALSRRPETKRERDRRLEREALERDKEEELLAFSLSGDEDEKDRERLRRKWRKDKERKERKEKGKGMVFEEDITNGHTLHSRYGAGDQSARGGKLRVETATGLGVYGAGGLMPEGGLAEKVRKELLEDRARGKFLSSDHETTHDEQPDSREYDRPLNGLPEETEFKRRHKIKIVEGYEEWEGYYEEGDEVEVEENYKGVADAFGKIFEKEGVRGFYTGVVEDTVSTTVNGLWYFATYSFLRHQRLKKLPPETTTLPVLEELSVGIVAGAISKFFTTPIANVVTRKQTAVLHAREHKCSHNHDPSYKNRHGHWCAHKHKHKRPTAVSIIQDIYDENGASGFWAGYKPTLLLTLNPAITFLLYELLKKGLPRQHRERQTKTQTFLLGALAKAFATTVTYPLAVVKTRSMIKSRKRMEASVKLRRKQTSTDSSSSSSSSDNSSDSSSDSGSDVGLKKYKKKYKKKYRMKYEKLRQSRGEGMTAVAKEIYKTEGVKGFYVGLWAEVLKGFFANGISMLIKETIFHTLTSMYLLVLRARNRTEDKSFTGTLMAISQELHEYFNSKQQTIVDRVDGVKQNAEDLIENGKERWHIGREKIVRGVTGGAGEAVYRNNIPEEEIVTKTTTTTVTEEIRQPVNGDKRGLDGNGNVNNTGRVEKTNSAGADMIKRKLHLRDSGRERIHEGTIHDGTHKLNHNRNVSNNIIDRTVTTTTTTINAPVISGVATADKMAVPSMPTHDRVANWLEHTEKEGIGMGAVPTPQASTSLPQQHQPPLVSLKHPNAAPQAGSLHLKPANTPFSQIGKGALIENMNGSGIGKGLGGIGGGTGNGIKTGTFDVSKSRNIMREVVSEGSGTRLEKEVVRDHVDWEEDDREWMRRR